MIPLSRSYQLDAYIIIIENWMKIIIFFLCLVDLVVQHLFILASALSQLINLTVVRNRNIDVN